MFDHWRVCFFLGKKLATYFEDIAEYHLLVAGNFPPQHLTNLKHFGMSALLSIMSIDPCVSMSIIYGTIWPLQFVNLSFFHPDPNATFYGRTHNSFVHGSSMILHDPIHLLDDEIICFFRSSSLNHHVFLQS